jgi:basic amino acid/polyamine antiporter, APA family
MGSGIYLALGVVALHGLGLTPVALVVAGLVVATVAFASAEGASVFPEAGGSAALARHAMNELASFVAGWAMCLALVAMAALSAVFATRYLSVFWDPLASGAWSAAGALVVIGLLAAACTAGMKLSTSAAAFAGVLDLVVQVLLVVLGVAFVFRPEAIQQNVDLGTAPSLEGLILACALALAAYTGIEAIGEMAADARDPERDLAPASAGLVASAVSVAAVVSLVALMAAPVVRSPGGGFTSPLAEPAPHGYAAAPVLAIVGAVPLNVLSTGLQYLVGLLVAVMLAFVAYTALTGCARLAAWLAQHHQLPALVADPHPTSQAPFVAITACGAAAALLAVVQASAGGVGALAGTYVFGALIAFTSVHVSIIALRWRDPGRYRPVEAPLNLPVDGRRIPLTALLGGACTAILWLAVVLLQSDARYVGTAWMVLGVAGYAAYRRRLGLSMTERTPAEAAARRGPGVEVEFQTLLIPVNTAAATTPTDLVDVAAQLAAERRASLVLLAFTEIPLGEEMDMEIDDLDGVVERLAAAGRAIGKQYGIHVHTSHLRTRDPAESILAEANRRDSQVILLRAGGLQRQDVRRVTYDHAVRRIVAEARQRVMIVRPEVGT